MATLYNTKISETYTGLIKSIDNLALTASLKELTDGSGSSTGIFLNTSGDFKVTSILEFGSLKDTGENIIISKFVDAADGIGNNDNDTTIPTTAAIIDYVAAQITIEDLDFTGDTGSGQIDLDSQIFAIGGTTNEITTVASGQSITFSLDSTGVNLPDNSTAITQTAGDNSTKIATTSYVDTLDAASDLDITDGTNTGDVNLNTQSLSILGTTNEIESVVSGQSVTIGLPSTINTNLVGNVTGNLTGDVVGDLTGNVTSTSVLANGVTATTQSSSDDSTKVATTAYVKGLNNASDLDFTTDSGSGAVVLNSETLSVVGTTNEIITSAQPLDGQVIQIGLPSTINVNLQGNVTGNVTGNLTGNVTGDLTGNSAGTHTGAVIGNVTGNVTGDLTGNADTATAWETARDLSVTGQASATITGVDGTSNVSASITLDNNSVTSKVLTGLPTPAASSVLATDSIVQGIGKLQSQINGLAGGLRFMGSWDATNNNPSLSSGGGEATSGTTTSTTANKLVDSSASFLTTVTVGDQVINQVDGQNALVSNVDSDTTLSLDNDIMVSGEAYTIDNSPFITQGHYYVVNVGGTTALNGISNWSVGDWVIAGANNEWTKLDHTQIDGTGTGDANDGNIPRFTASNIIGDSIIRETGGNLITVSGTLSTTGNLNAQGDFAINTDKFTTQASTGNTAFAGDLAINTNKFTVNATSGNTAIAGDVTATQYNVSNTSGYLVREDTGSGYGLFKSSTTNIGIASNGNVALNFDSSSNATFAGNLTAVRGIFNSGTTNNVASFTSTDATAKLQCVDNVGLVNFGANGDDFIVQPAGGTTQFTVGSSSSTFAGTVTAPELRLQGTGTTYLNIGNNTTGSASSDGASIGYFTGQSSLQIVQRENDAMVFSTNNSESMRIDSSGNVGIAWSSPSDFTSVNADNLVVGSGIGSNGITVFSATNAYGQLAFADGTGTNDQYKGLIQYAHPDDSMRLFTANTERMRIDSSGNVGIGTISATSSSKVTIQAQGVNGSDETALVLRNYSASPFTGYVTTEYEIGTINIAEISARRIDINNGELIFRTKQSGTITDALTIDSSGNVGIGTTDPEQKLHVEGASITVNRGNDDSSIAFQNSTSNATWRIGRDYSNSEALTFAYSATDYPSLTGNGLISIDTSGNVGIGVSTVNNPFPYQAALQVGDTSTATNNGLITIGSGTTGSGDIYFADGTSGGSQYKGFVSYKHNGDYLAFGTAETTRMIIDSSGIVKIFTTGGTSEKTYSATAGLQLYSQQSDAGSPFTKTSDIVANGDGTVPSELRMFTKASGSSTPTERMRITSGGDVLFGTTGTPNGTSVYGSAFTDETSNRMILRMASSTTGDVNLVLFYNGNGLVGKIQTSGSATSYITSSDYRLKEDLQDFNGLDKVSKIPVYDFKWKTDESRSYGVMAHELQEVLPQAVSGEKDAEEMQGVDYSKIVPLLVKSIQELKAEVDKLKQECKCKN